MTQIYRKISDGFFIVFYTILFAFVIIAMFFSNFFNKLIDDNIPKVLIAIGITLLIYVFGLFFRIIHRIKARKYS